MKKPLITRDDLLGSFRGGAKRRAGVALALIEARAAIAAVEHGSVNARFMTQSAFEARNQAYLGAVAKSADNNRRLRIRDLERSADKWSELVPHNPEIRAELAALIGEKYRVVQRLVPRLSDALGFDSLEVQKAFEASHGSPLSSIFHDRISALEKLKWAWFGLGIRIDRLPPFWTAFALTITETVGAGTLALPIAFSSVGPLPGLVLLFAIGLVNLATVAYFAEASARNGSIRYGSAFVGRLVSDFLGVSASRLLLVCLFSFCCIMLASYYTGFASTLSAVTGFPPYLWVFVIFGVGLFLVLRKSLMCTLASALIIGLLNITILVLLSIFALSFATVENLTFAQVPFVNGRAFEPSHLQLVFGIVLVSYFGHLSVSNCAQAVLRRDPGGRALKWGTVSAMAAAIATYCLWTLGVNGAVGSAGLAGETGTALVPLAKRIGPEVYVLGVVFAILGLGMSSIHFGLGIFNMSQEFVGGIFRGNKASRFRKHTASLVAAAPILMVFGYVQWTYYNGTPSFTAPMELLGAILTPILAGIFPVLLLIASRARGFSVSGAKLPALATNGFVLALVVIVSFAGLLMHGLVIWDDTLPRIFAIGAAVVMTLLIGDLLRKRVFSPSICVALRYMPEKKHEATVSIACSGEWCDLGGSILRKNGATEVLEESGVVADAESALSLGFDLASVPVSWLSIDARKVFNDFHANALSGAVLFYANGKEVGKFSLDSSSGLTRTPIPAGSQEMQIALTWS